MQRGAINLAEFSEAAPKVALGARVARGEATPFSPASDRAKYGSSYVGLRVVLG